MKRLFVALLIFTLSCATLSAQEMPLVNISPPPPTLFAKPPYRNWMCWFGCVAPWSLRPDGYADLTPEPETFEAMLARLWRHVFVETAQSTLRADGLVDLSPPPRPFYAAMLDNWPSGLLLPRRAVVLRPDGTADISPFPKTSMYAGGIDGWRQGAFVYGALLWSPQGLSEAGFTVKLMSGGGSYRYTSGALAGAEVIGTQRATSILSGWRFKQGTFEATLLAGFDMQEHLLSRFDPGNALAGISYGVRLTADLWHEPKPGAMVAASVSWSSIGPNYSARIATGWWTFDNVWLGPELQNIGNPAYGGPSYMQWRFGAHATAFVFNGFEWSFGLGYVVDSDRRDGAYGRFSLLGRY